MDVTAEHDEVHHSELGAYRAPRKRLWFEGMSSRITAQQFLLSGPLSLEAIDAAAHALAVAVLERLNGAQPRRLVAVRMGQPQLVPLRGDWAGRSIAVGQGPFTLIADCGRIANEWDWLAEVGPEWVRAIGLRSSNADWLRRYHPVLDACVSVELITVMTENARLETEAVAQIHERDWERSAYCLLNGGPELALSDAPLEPTERYLWADGRTFAIWHFRAFAGPLAVLDSDHDEPDWGMPTAEQERSVLSVIERVRRWMSERGHESLAPRTARYMRALLAGDPYPTHRMRYRFVDLEMGKTYPSPIDPRERSVLADIAWRLEVDVDEAVEELIDDVLAQWSRACGISRDSYLYELDDPDELAATHWFLRVQVADNVDPLLSTRDHVDGLMKSLPEKLGQLEEMLAQATPGTTRATRQYWRDLCFLDFQVPVEAQR